MEKGGHIVRLFFMQARIRSTLKCDCTRAGMIFVRFLSLSSRLREVAFAVSQNLDRGSGVHRHVRGE